MSDPPRERYASLDVVARTGFEAAMVFEVFGLIIMSRDVHASAFSYLVRCGSVAHARLTTPGISGTPSTPRH
jgi:uncharacterized membrane protein